MAQLFFVHQEWFSCSTCIWTYLDQLICYYTHRFAWLVDSLTAASEAAISHFRWRLTWGRPTGVNVSPPAATVYLSVLKHAETFALWASLSSQSPPLSCSNQTKNERQNKTSSKNCSKSQSFFLRKIGLKGRFGRLIWYNEFMWICLQRMRPFWTSPCWKRESPACSSQSAWTPGSLPERQEKTLRGTLASPQFSHAWLISWLISRRSSCHGNLPLRANADFCNAQSLHDMHCLALCDKCGYRWI